MDNDFSLQITFLLYFRFPKRPKNVYRNASQNSSASLPASILSIIHHIVFGEVLNIVLLEMLTYSELTHKLCQTVIFAIMWSSMNLHNSFYCIQTSSLDYCLWGGTHILRHMVMCRFNGSLFTRDPEHGSHFLQNTP